MTEAAAVAVQTGIEVNTSRVGMTPIQQDTNPYEVRWGFQMSQREKNLNAQECGVAIAPFGQFFPIRSFNRPQENHTIDWTQPKELIALHPAAACEDALMQSLGGHGAQNQVNWGLKTAFLGETDAGKMAVISTVLLPKLSIIREIQADLFMQVIEDKCPGEDPLDSAPRESCVSCWWKWLNSNTLAMYIDKAANQTFEVQERDPSSLEVIPRMVRVTKSDLQTALAVVLESGRIGIRQLEDQWKRIADEYSKGDKIRKDITDFEHGYRRDLHQARPEDRQLEMVREMGKSVGGGGGDNSELLARLAESSMQTNQLLQQIVSGQQTAAPLNGLAAVLEDSAAPFIALPVDVIESTTTVASDDAALNPITEDLAPAAQAMEAAKNSKGKKER